MYIEENKMKTMIIVALMALATSPAVAQAIKVVNKNPNFGFKLTSARLNGDNVCAKMGFTEAVLDDKGTITLYSRNQGVLNKSNFVQRFGSRLTEAMTCNLAISYETDSKTKIQPTEGRMMGSASIARGHKVAISSRIASSSKTQPAESSYESPSAPMRVNVNLNTVPIDKLGAAIPCGTKDTITMRLAIALKGSSDDTQGSEIRLGTAERVLPDGRIFSTYGFTASGC